MRLPVGSAHLWLLPLGPPAGPGLLSADEAQRAGRLKDARARDRFISSRTILRSLLSLYTGERPEGISFAYERSGRPFLEGSGISFSLSHSGDMAAFAFASGRAVGVDIEMLGGADHAALSKLLSEKERASIGSLPPDSRAQAFYRLWTRKEACVKAKGGSIFRSLHEDIDSSGWSIEEYSDGFYTAALAVEGEGAPIIRMDQRLLARPGPGPYADIERMI